MDNTSLIFIIFIFSLLIVCLIVAFTSIKNHFEFKEKSSVTNLNKSIEYSVEDGKGVHLSVGKSDLNNIHGAASLIGLETSKNILAQSGLSDTSPVITSGSGDISLLTQTAAAHSTIHKSKFGQISEPQEYLAGPTNMSFIAGIIPSSSNQNLSSQLFIGNFGPEIGLVLHESKKKHHFSFTATDDLAGQSISYINSDETILGDQIFSISSQITHKSSNFTMAIIQDIFRWFISLAIILLVFLKLLGIL